MRVGHIFGGLRQLEQMNTWETANRVLEAISDMSPRRVIVFGSGVKGSVVGDLDLDLAVVFDDVGDEFDRLETTLAIRRRIRQINAEVAIDIVVYTESEYRRLAAQRSFLRSQIIDRGRVIYEKAG